MSFRAVFFEQQDAEAAAARLVADGFLARTVRERLAGEDDDDDHPWAVLTDAPEVVVELLVERYDGWLDIADPPVPAETAPLPPLPRWPLRRGGGSAETRPGRP